MNLDYRDELGLERPFAGRLTFELVACQAEPLVQLAALLVGLVDLVARCLLNVMIYILRYRFAFLGYVSLVGRWFQ